MENDFDALFESTQGEPSKTPTPYMVNCPRHGKIYLTHEEYERQMWQMNSLWKCPICGRTSQWDDDNYDSFYQEEEENGNLR